MDLQVTKVETQSNERTAPSSSAKPSNIALQRNGTAGESGTSPEPNSNGGNRQTTRKSKSLKSEDASGATFAAIAVEQPRSLRGASNGTDKRSLPEETDYEDSSSAKTGVAKRQSTRARTPRQTYQDQFQQRSEKVSFHLSHYRSLVDRNFAALPNSYPSLGRKW